MYRSMQMQVKSFRFTSNIRNMISVTLTSVWLLEPELLHLLQVLCFLVCFLLASIKKPGYLNTIVFPVSLRASALLRTL